MVTVSLYNLLKEKNEALTITQKDIKLTVSGHAAVSQKGNDIVCAGISAIVETAVLAISKVADIRQKIKQENGYLETSIKYSDLDIQKSVDLLVILNTMLIGLEEIKKTNPESINIKIINQEA